MGVGVNRIGLAGLGRMGKRYLQHIEPHSILRRCHVIRDLGQSHKMCGDEQTAINNWLSDIDLVIIATPAATHADLVCEALEARKPTLCEKPLCTTREELARIREVWERTGTPLLVDHPHLWHPEFVRIRNIITYVRSQLPAELGVKARFGDRSGDWSWLEWSPHPLALCCALSETWSRWFSVSRGPFKTRSRSIECELHSKNMLFAIDYDGDSPCDPPPLARVVDDFVNQRIDWRWNEFGFRVMDLVLDGLNTSGA